MKDLGKAQQLVTLFIQCLKDYENKPSDELMRKLKQLNTDYKEANGGGDLFKVTNSQHLL
jgi:hypothetical protein